MKRPIILDTSLFVNPAAASVFGPTPTAAFRRFLEMASGLKDIQFLMPPSIYSELMHFAEESKIPKNLLLVVEQRPPKKHEIRIPGIFIYSLVENMRERVDRGLRLAERHVREALQMPPVPQNKEAGRVPGKAYPDAEVIGRLRETYRRIMREGMLDSRADVDLLLLAYETEGTLVSADEGVLSWADNMGIRILPHAQLYDFLTEKLPK